MSRPVPRERGRARIGRIGPATEDLGGLWCCPETGQFFCGWKGPPVGSAYKSVQDETGLRSFH